MNSAPDPAAAHDAIQAEISKVLIGNESVVERLTISLFTGGHVLLEGVPGVAKTTTAELFARATGLDFGRIQLTPDTLPADITGTTVYREQTGAFETVLGPVFTNVVVADEINRSTPKTQSALLEAMQERQVTIDGETRALPEPFLVVATQNPIEMEGTFELPEAQRDRFQFKIDVGHLERDDELTLLDRFDDQPNLTAQVVEPVLDAAEISRLAATVDTVYVGTPVKSYLLDVVAATREHSAVTHGASPRATLTFQRAVKARAAIQGRGYVLPDDIKALAGSVLAHRLVLETEATLSGVAPREVVTDILDSVEPPSAEAVRQAQPTADGAESDQRQGARPDSVFEDD